MGNRRGGDCYFYPSTYGVCIFLFTLLKSQKMEGLETKKTIYDVFVPIENQEQCDRLKKLCVDYGLPIWTCSAGWEYLEWFSYALSYEIVDGEFFCFDMHSVKNKSKTKVTETEFIELLKQHKK